MGLVSITWSHGMYCLSYSILSPETDLDYIRFVKRRGFAVGVMFAGTAFGGLVFPLIISPMIKSIGLPWTFRALSFAVVVIVTPLLRFIKGRLPESRVQGPVARSSSNKAWMTDMRFWLMIAANTSQALAYFIPIVWLPSTCTALLFKLFGSQENIQLSPLL